MNISFDESRRLTGPNLFTDSAGAVLELYCEGIEVSSAVECWEKHLKALMWGLDLEGEIFHRIFDGGANNRIQVIVDIVFGANVALGFAWIVRPLHQTKGVPVQKNVGPLFLGLFQMPFQQCAVTLGIVPMYVAYQ